MTALQFNAFDSWAYWSVPANVPSDPEAKQQAFGANYKPETFPLEQLGDDVATKLQQTRYVLIGMNPGNAVVDHPADKQFLNFHGQKRSMDYRLAAATYGTDLWGAFMTDLSHTIESDSGKVKLTESDVADLERHLDELGVPASATLVALGKPSFELLSKFAKRPVKGIPHYSGANSGAGENRWNAEGVHQQILEITRG